MFLLLIIYSDKKILQSLGFVAARLDILVQKFKLGNVNELRNILCISQAYISRSAALYLLHPDKFFPNNVDFYVRKKGFSILLKYIIDCGYVFPKPNSSHTSTLTVSKSSHLSSKIGSNYNSVGRLAIVLEMHHHSSPSIKINIVLCCGSHLVTAISRFHSMIVMNYLAWYGLVSLYPHWTMDSVGVINRNWG